MNYQKIYDTIVVRAQTRPITGYTENHHIVPRCMGGTYDKSNLVRLTPEEHFLCHQLLVRIHENTEYRYKLVYAAKMMTITPPSNIQRNISKLKLYGWLRARFSEAQKAKVFSPEYRAKISAGRAGIPVTAATRKLISEGKKGKPNPKLSLAVKGVPKPWLSEQMLGKA